MTDKKIKRHWPLSELCQGMKRLVIPEIIISKDIVVSGVTCDSRNVSEDFLFAAFKGEQSDGADYIPKAIKAGASVILCGLNDPIKNVPDHVHVIRHPNPRLAFSYIVERFYVLQPATMVAVTGTNGKTSVAHFCSDLWQKLGYSSACMGTNGVIDGAGKPIKNLDCSLTTPSCEALHELLQTMNIRGCTHMALEASSHGLNQYRMHGVNIVAAGFTSFSRDHLDYHGSESEYFDSKMLLFKDILPEKTGVAVLNADIIEFRAIQMYCDEREQTVLSYGKAGKDIKLLERHMTPNGQSITIEIGGQSYTVELPLIGEFQVSNVLCAMGLLMATGINEKLIIGVMGAIRPVEGRMQIVTMGKKQPMVVVDYAHTPDGLSKALRELRAMTKGKLAVVFGCGGNRDEGKRELMGKVAAEQADYVVVTDDNPRNEDPAMIRSQILKSCPSANEEADRAKAIALAIDSLSPKDILLIAGKGHEKTQLTSGKLTDFDDVNIAQSCKR